VEWADELAGRVSGPQVVNDSKTPSGTVHVGSLRGPVILDVIARALRARGIDTTMLYGVDDMDPMDAQALLTPDAVEREMGKPLAQVADPAGDCHPSYARHFAGVFIDTFAGLGIHPDRYYWMSDIYPTGAMDPFIRTALDRAQVVRDLYVRVSHVERPSGWLPVQVVCPACGKVGTTIALDWDGETVRVECRPDYVTWARGCGFVGRIAPFGGAAKLYWNLEWAAQWSLFGVTIEPCGKDLATAGGSRDRADAISQEVFEREPPINIPYEFLNIGGRKMSTSKGRGAAAHRIVEVVPPEQLRLLFLRPRPNQAIEFDPEGTDAIPRLFDEFDRLAAATAGREVKGELPGGYEAVFRYSLLRADADVAGEAAAFRPDFAHLALLVQVPGADIGARVEAEKGASLTLREREILAERTAAAAAWLETYAPERARIVVRPQLPEEAGGLDAEQRRYLAALAVAAERAWPATGDDWQTLIFATAAESALPAGRSFAALYAAFLGRANGPRAGWLLASLRPGFVIERLRAAASSPDAATPGMTGASASVEAGSGDGAASGGRPVTGSNLEGGGA
jgi:lysyl-tRNA synthetase, class I